MSLWHTSIQTYHQKLGVTLALEKLVGPSQIISFLGIELDSQVMEARIPEDKLVKYQSLSETIVEAESATMGDMLSLAG